MEYIKSAIITVLLLSLQISCIEANVNKHFIASETPKGYIVRMDGKVVNQLFVFFVQKGNKGERIHLRVVLNHRYGTECNGRFARINYCDFISALDCVLNQASKTYNISQLYSIEIDLISLGEECLRITKDYKYSFNRKTTIKPKDIQQVLERSRLISDIRNILSHFHSTILYTKTETAYYADWKEFSSYNILEKIPDNLISRKVLRGIVYVYCKQSQK